MFPKKVDISAHVALLRNHGVKPSTRTLQDLQLSPNTEESRDPPPEDDDEHEYGGITGKNAPTLTEEDSFDDEVADAFGSLDINAAMEETDINSSSRRKTKNRYSLSN